jgi:hypothetical protein
MFNSIVGTGAVGAGAGTASRYSSGSDKKMRLRLRNTAYYQSEKVIFSRQHFLVLYLLLQLFSKP